jgi:hypothetical protein
MHFIFRCSVAIFYLISCGQSLFHAQGIGTDSIVISVCWQPGQVVFRADFPFLFPVTRIRDWFSKTESPANHVVVRPGRISESPYLSMGNNLGPNQLSRGCKVFCSRSTKQRSWSPRRDVDAFAVHADADEDVAVVEGIGELRQAQVSSGQGFVDLGRGLHGERLMRSFLIVFF